MSLAAAERVLLDALVERLGRPKQKNGADGWGALAYVAGKLTDAGVTPETLDALLTDFAQDVIAQNPNALLAFLNGRAATDRRFVGVASWPQECHRCRREIRRGELVWLRRQGEGWHVTCADCEPVDHGSERADLARRHALEREKGDPDELVAAILVHTPVELREQIQDDLTMALEAGRG